MTTRGSTFATSRVRRGHKERSKNFTELEKRTVLELIARHRDVLRQGRSNNATNRSKQLVWSTICDEVNKRVGGDRPRTPAQVKMWYENYKKKCKMRATDTTQPQESTSLLDGMLWQNVNPLDMKDDDIDGAASMEGSHHSVKDDDCHPLNMSNGRLSSNNDSDDTMTNVLEPQVKIVSHSPSPTHSPLKPLAPHIPPLLNQTRLHSNLYLPPYNDSTPLNLSHLDDDKRNGYEKKDKNEDRNLYKTSDEEKLYFTAKRQHAIWEHEAKMKILNMELKQKEELFLIQKQLFLIELRLKMEFYEKATASPAK